MTSLPVLPTPKKLGLVIDLDICVGCHACVISCKEWNTGGYGAALSDQDPYGADVSGTFLNRIQEVVPLYDVRVGLVKAPVFGLIVALTGCFQGMQVKGNSEDVGKRTTKAVVQAIFMVIVLDAFFAVFFTEVGWA